MWRGHSCPRELSEPANLFGFLGRPRKAALTKESKSVQFREHMRWIKRREEFDNAHGQASTCKYIDSGRYPTALKRWVFDDAQILTADFAQLLQSLIGWSADAHATYVVLNPDPIYYFWRHFEKYPAVELEAGDSPGTYLSVLSEDPGGDRRELVGMCCSATVEQMVRPRFAPRSRFGWASLDSCGIDRQSQ